MGLIPPWADLPPELLSAIASCLSSNPIDILHFRSVCKSWYSSSLSLSTSPSLLSLSPLLPLRLPRPPYPLRGGYGFSCSTFSLLTVTAIYALRPPAEWGEDEDSLSNPKTWLLFVDQLNPGKVTIRRPFTRGSFFLPLDFPRKLSLLDFRVSEIGRFCNLSNGYCNPSGKFVMRGAWAAEAVKVVLMSNGTAVVVLSEDGKLGLLKLGGEKDVMGSEWEIIHDGRGFRFDDIVEYNSRLLGIDRRGRVYEMGHDFAGMNVIVPPITGGGGRRKRLIESCGILHLVVRCDVNGKPETMGNIKVYQFKGKSNRWAEVLSTDGMVFFFGTGYSFAGNSQEFEGFCGKNCIMYEERSFRKYDGGYGDSWLFEGLGRSSLKVGVYHIEDGAHLHAIESYPCYSDILWPPPSWIWLNSKSKFLGTIEAAIDRLVMRIPDENLKAKYKELSSLVGVLVCADERSPEQILTAIKEINILKKLMTEIDLVIERESKSIEKHLLEDATSRRTQRDFVKQLKQMETSDQEGEDRRGCVHFQEKAALDSTGHDGWLSREVNLRLGTHIELPKILKGIVKVLEEHSDLADIFLSRLEEHRDWVNILLSRQQASLPSIPADGNTILSEST